jgi:hypothetical protein
LLFQFQATSPSATGRLAVSCFVQSGSITTTYHFSTC